MKTISVHRKSLDSIFDVFGPSVEFLNMTGNEDDIYTVMKGIVPPGISVPLHIHPDDESFFILSGTMQIAKEQENRFDWIDVKKDDFIHIPGNVKHALRNQSDEPVSGIIITTAKLGKFFLEVGRPVKDENSLPPPTPDEIEHFTKTVWAPGRK